MTLPTLNVLLRMHWSKRRRLQQEVAWECMRAMRLASIRADKPMDRCEVRIVRHSRREPDPDGLPGTAKLLLDALQPRSKVHPCGLGLIVDDGPKCIRKLTVQHAKALRIKADGHLTQVFVTEVCDELLDDR